MADVVMIIGIPTLFRFFGFYADIVHIGATHLISRIVIFRQNWVMLISNGRRWRLRHWFNLNIFFNILINFDQKVLDFSQEAF